MIATKTPSPADSRHKEEISETFKKISSQKLFPSEKAKSLSALVAIYFCP